MLVSNKFIYISLPRCSSTSFMISCIKHNIPINHTDTSLNNELRYIDKNLSSEQLAYQLRHNHETYSDLIDKFGRTYDVISIKRDRYSRFISSWEHLIHELEKRNEIGVANVFKEFNEIDLLKYTSLDISEESNILEYINYFLNENRIKLSTNINHKYLINMLLIHLSPLSIWHNHNPNIIWFDFDKLYELEEWVSNKLEKPFKLERLNSSKHIECNLKLTDNFIKKYNKIYDSYDFRKEKKTLI